MSKHRYAFRREEWAEILNIKLIDLAMPPEFRYQKLRPCFHIRFADGVEDYWPIYDQDADYIFDGDIVLL